jgi:uncharacterized membrane protein YphA (DoxX/SURF4 family)
MVQKRASVDVVFVLQIVLAVFLVTLGIVEITQWNSDLARLGRGISRVFGRPNSAFNLIVGIVELAAGVIVFLGLFFSVKTRLLYFATLVIAILWAVRIILGFFGQQAFEPDFVTWLNRLAADLVILLSLWLINRKYA